MPLKCNACHDSWAGGREGATFSHWRPPAPGLSWRCDCKKRASRLVGAGCGQAWQMRLESCVGERGRERRVLRVRWCRFHTPAPPRAGLSSGVRPLRLAASDDLVNLCNLWGQGAAVWAVGAGNERRQRAAAWGLAPSGRRTSGAISGGVGSSPLSVVRPVVPSPNIACRREGRHGEAWAVRQQAGGRGCRRPSHGASPQPPVTRAAVAAAAAGGPCCARRPPAGRRPPATRSRSGRPAGGEQHEAGGLARDGEVQERRHHAARPPAAATWRQASAGEASRHGAPATRRRRTGLRPWPPPRSCPGGTPPARGVGRQERTTPAA